MSPWFDEHGDDGAQVLCLSFALVGRGFPTTDWPDRQGLVCRRFGQRHLNQLKFGEIPKKLQPQNGGGAAVKVMSCVCFLRASLINLNM